MHSRILVLNDSNYDVDEVFEEMSSYGNGVDYVCESESPYEEDYDWAMSYLTELGFISNVSKNEFIIHDESFFWDSMEQDIRDLLDDGGVRDLNRYKIEDRAGMKHSFWIYYDGILYTLPYFVQEYGKKRDRMWRVTKFLDYHY